MPPQSVVQQPNGFAAGGGMGPVIGGLDIPQLAGYSIVAQFAEAADSIPAWGTQPGIRDRSLREFWPTEPFFASALFNTVARYAAFGWALKGGPRTVKVLQNMLHTAEHGKGWIPFVTKVLIDLYTQDNGAFIEVARATKSPTSPPVSLNHLDSGRCVRTGLWDYPVIYYDIDGQGHRMHRSNVIDISEFPSPNERWRGMQYCALTRCLRAAQIIREIQIYKREKVSGRFTKTIYLVGGVPTRMIDEAIKQHDARADSQGLMRYMQPLIIGSLDPTAKVESSKLDLASLPDGYDEETTMHWYISQLALAFGTDYQNFAPLPGRGGSTTGSASATSNMRQRGKGPELFMSIVEQALNFHGVMPSNVHFQFGEQDNAAELERILLGKEYAMFLQILVESGTITTQVSRQMLVDRGFMDPEYLTMMHDTDPTDIATIDAGDNLPITDPATIEPGQPGPNAPPKAAGPGGGFGSDAAPTPLNANSNARKTRAPTTTQRPTIPASGRTTG